MKRHSNMGDSKKYQKIEIINLYICFFGWNQGSCFEKILQLKEYDELIVFKETGPKLKEDILPNGK